MNKENKKSNLMIFGVVGLLVLMLIIVVIVLLATKNNNVEEKQGENAGNEVDSPEGINFKNPEAENIEDSILNGYDMKCELVTESTDPKITYYENLKTDGKNVLSSRTSALLEYSSSEAYKTGKEDPAYKDGKFDDANLRIEYLLGDEVDYTKAEDGTEINILLDNYFKNLKDNGYKCR